MKKGSLFSFLFILFFVVLLGLFVLGIVFYLSSNFNLFYSSIELSPLEGEIFVDDSVECRDSDGGIFFNERGEVNYKQEFIFFDFDRVVVDKCNGDELSEYYCSDGVVVEGIVYCDGGCVDGTCLELID